LISYSDQKTPAAGSPSAGDRESNHTMEDPGQKLRRIRERLNLRVRDVEQASLKIADKYHNDDFAVLINRISEIENRNLVPSIHKLYSLCAIYRLDFQEVLDWYGVSLTHLPSDAACVEVPQTHLLAFRENLGSRGLSSEVLLPLTLDPGLDVRRTTYLTRMVQRWGKLPLLFLESLDLMEQRYALIGTEDPFMSPLLQPGTFVSIDETQQKIANSGWSNEFERPIYFFEHRQGFACGWASLNGEQLVVSPHPLSGCSPQVYKYPTDIDLIGQVSGIAMRLDQARRRRLRP
jgi:transcriptional regulator with XRE-family HTH domain